VSPTRDLLAVYIAATKVIKAVREGREVSLEDLVRAVDSVQIEDVSDNNACVEEAVVSTIVEDKPKRKRKKNEVPPENPEPVDLAEEHAELPVASGDSEI
jgi:hypothetical protein